VPVVPPDAIAGRGRHTHNLFDDPRPRPPFGRLGLDDHPVSSLQLHSFDSSVASPSVIADPSRGRASRLLWRRSRRYAKSPAIVRTRSDRADHPHRAPPQRATLKPPQLPSNGCSSPSAHERGAGLEDEYDSNADATETYDLASLGEPDRPNVTCQTWRSNIKWADLIDPNTPIPTTENTDCTQPDAGTRRHRRPI
jgi:hypothetical protein